MKYIYLMLLSILPVVCFSQSSYVPGSLVKSNGETVNGYINYNPKQSETPLYVEFKDDVSKPKAQWYSISQLRSFQIDGKDKYVTFQGAISMDKNHFPDIASSLDTSLMQGEVFLHVVYEGKKVSLFSQTDKFKTRYFVADGNAPPTELKYHYYFDPNQNTDRQVYTYKGQLAILAQKYNNADKHMMRKLDGLPFEEHELKQVAELINDEKSADESYTGKFFIGLALNYDVVKFEGTTPFDQAQYSAVIPQVNLGFDFFRPVPTSRIILRGEFSFWAIKPRFNAMVPSGFFDIPAPATYQYDQYTVAFTPQFIYKVYKKNKQSLFAGIGPQFNFSSFKNNSVTGDRNPTPYKLESFTFGVPVEVGFIVGNKFDVTATYCFPKGNTAYSDFTINTSTNIGLGVHWVL